MRSGTHFVYVFGPFLLTAASLTFQVMVGLGCTNNHLSNVYFLQANTTVLANASFAAIPANSVTNSAEKTANGEIIIKNYYDIGLWGYCASDRPKPSSTEIYKAVSICTATQLHFAFDPRLVWAINDSLITNSSNLGDDLQSALDSYKMVSKWISNLYIIAVVTTGAELLVEIFGIFHSLDSVFTCITSFISSCFVWESTVLATVTYTGLANVLTAGLKQYRVTFSIGPAMFTYMWLAVSCMLTSQCIVASR